MRKTYSLGKRVLAVLLCIAMVAAYLPGMAVDASAALADNKKVDLSTMDGWQEYFGPDVMSTEYTGGVWTDKSVFTSFAEYQRAEAVTEFISPAGNEISDEVKQMLATDPESFLVALSAITANKSVSGSASTPLDTVLTLDVSGSMQGNNAVAMVQATNEAIHTLLEQNTNNRISVVLYSGNHSFGNSQASSASVLLPMGRYTTTNTMRVNANKTIPAYLTISGSGDSQTVSVASSVNNGSGADRKTVRGGTYIQNGLFQAWKQFQAVTDTKVPAGQVQEGTQRTPVVILMSDGAPTTATTAYNNVAASNLGDGGSTSNRYAFMTQLTAAWVRGKIGEHYNTTPKFYTLGIGTGTSTEATSVLNPAGSNETLNDYWENFEHGTDGQNVAIVTGRNGWSVYKDAAVVGKNYVDQYWLANNADGLIDAFKKIVQTIVLQAEKHSTLVEAAQGADMSGYVTFEDELGELIDVKAVKGLVIGNVIFTGAELAKGFNITNMGTVDEPTAYGDEFIRTVKERLGITDTAVAQQLVQNAYLTGQLKYTGETNFSNYIGWYADDNGNYKGFWQESDGYGLEAAPQGATYINRSYGYLGKAGASDMMHVVVMVHTRISDGHQSIVFKIPASLIPAVTYHIELNGNDASNVKSITREAAEPMRLLVEVGLRDEINAVNLENKIAEHRQKGGHVHENRDGTYTFYTNRWGDGDGGEVNYDEPLTHLVTESHFHPALENERYYHVMDATVFSDANGTVYRGAARPSGNGYYLARTYYEIVSGTARQVTEYAPLAAVTADEAEQGANGWYIPAGTPQQLTRFAKEKGDKDLTKTLDYSWNPVVLHDNSGYNSYAFLGNNGSFTVSPAQGIALSKSVTEAVAGAPTEFTFKVTLDQEAENLLFTDLDGNTLNNAPTVNGRVITVKLAAGETVVITGIPTGTTYTVEEEATGYYTASITNATGPVTAHTITQVAAVNQPRIYNDLIVSKDVLPPAWMTDITALEDQEFSIRVTITGADANTTYTTSNAVRFVTDANGTASQVITLKDAQSLTVYDLPAGAAYSVAEINVPAGHTANATDAAPITGRIPTDGNAVAGVTNTYAPDAAEIILNLTGTKTFLTTGGQAVPDDAWPKNGFIMELYYIDQATGEPTFVRGDIQAKADNKTWSASVPLSFDKTGVYNYKIVEKAGGEGDITYDATNGLFEIIVSDDASGTLKVSQVLAVQGTTEVTENNGSYTVDKDFTNYKAAGSVSIPVQKIVRGSDTISVNDFVFGLYEGETLIDTVIGNGAFVIAGFSEDFQTAKHYTIKEIVPSLENRIIGMTYDNTVYEVSVVWNNAANKLEATVAGATGNMAVFTNTYADPVSSPSIDLSGAKTLSGDRAAFLDGEKYTFELYRTGASFDVAAGTLVDSDEVSGSDYGFAFDGLTFKQEGVYYFVVKEKTGTQPGVTYDLSEYHVTVHVVRAIDQNNKTVLRSSATIHKLGTNTNVAENGLNFTNTYKITGTAEVTVSGMKYLDGRELIANEFAFGLYEGNTLLQSVKNRTNGTFDFAPITYTAADIGTHTYTVKEIVPAQKAVGITYDENTEYTVQVVVEDDDRGGLKVTKTVNGDEDTEIEFTNKYKANPTSAQITAKKTLYDVDADTYLNLTDGQFTFELYDSDETFQTQGDKVVTTNDANGDFSFTKNYTEAGDHYYILREVIGEVAGMQYDAGRYLIHIRVSDDGEGQLYAVTTVTHEGIGAVNDIVFGNLYDAEATTAVISGTKELVGGTLNDGDFTFELYENGQLLQTAENAGNAFAFEAIVYTKAGTYTYTVKEHNPAQTGNVHNGVIYDTTEYSVTVTVSDENGKLVADVRTSSPLAFVNRVKLNPQLTIKKEQALKGNPTTGKLAVKAGDVITYTITVANSGEGDAENITVTDKLPEGLILVDGSANEGGTVANGTVTWTLATLEAGDSVKLIFKAKTPTVEEETTWTNVATLVYDGEPTESNKVNAEQKPPSATPVTGDDSPVALFFSLMTISAFGMAALVICKKREEEKETA